MKTADCKHPTPNVGGMYAFGFSLMTEAVPAVILAGGRSARLGGGDKCLLPLCEDTILSHIVAVLTPQAGDILINSNSNPELFAATGLPIRADLVPGRLGPLAGILTAMAWARALGAPRVLTVPCDTPFLPTDLARRLFASPITDRPVIAASYGVVHPTVGLWPIGLIDRLRCDLEGGARRAGAWLKDISFAVVDFPPSEVDTFFNVNTQRDWERARAENADRIARYQAGGPLYREPMATKRGVLSVND